VRVAVLLQQLLRFLHFLQQLLELVKDLGEVVIVRLVLYHCADLFEVLPPLLFLGAHDTALLLTF
jgi:hypothetical protein